MRCPLLCDQTIHYRVVIAPVYVATTEKRCSAFGYAWLRRNAAYLLFEPLFTSAHEHKELPVGPLVFDDVPRYVPYTHQVLVDSGLDVLVVASPAAPFVVVFTKGMSSHSDTCLNASLISFSVQLSNRCLSLRICVWCL